MVDYHIQCAAYAGIIRRVFGEQIEDAYIVVAIGGRRRQVMPGKARSTRRSHRLELSQALSSLNRRSVDRAKWFSKLRAQFCCKTIPAQVVHMDKASLEKHWKLWLRRLDRFNGKTRLKRKKPLPGSSAVV